MAQSLAIIAVKERVCLNNFDFFQSRLFSLSEDLSAILLFLDLTGVEGELLWVSEHVEWNKASCGSIWRTLK